MTHYTHSDALVYSHLSPYPLVYFNQKYNAWFTAWHGYIMTAEQALIIATSKYNSMVYPPSIISEADRKAELLLAAGAFEEHSITVHHHSLSWGWFSAPAKKESVNIHTLQSFLSNKFTNVTDPKEIFSWFSPWIERGFK